MIAYLSGTIQSKSAQHVVLLTQGGVGYQVALSRPAVAAVSIGQTLSVHTYLKVSDADMALYGFEQRDARDFFELLLGVKGVGPKSAMNILSLGTVADITDAIARGDATYLSAVQGMGKKTAERLCVELKQKVTTTGSPASDHMGDVLGDVIDALISLGYTKDEAQQAVRQLDTAGASTEELIRRALQQSGK